MFLSQKHTFYYVGKIQFVCPLQLKKIEGMKTFHDKCIMKNAGGFHPEMKTGEVDVHS